MRNFWAILVATALVGCAGAERDLSELDIAGLHDQMQRGELTSVQLVEWYLARIDAIDRVTRSCPVVRRVLGQAAGAELAGKRAILMTRRAPRAVLPAARR